MARKIFLSLALILASFLPGKPASALPDPSAEEPILYFYNWSEYIPPELLKQFTEESGIKVVYSTYDANETLYAKLKTYQKGSYDLIVPSTYFISKMSSEGMLQKIDKSKLANFKELDPELMNQPFDPENSYSIPYLWGYSGIGVNSSEVDPSEVQSWGDLWHEKYRNQIILPNDAREVFHIALRKLGYSGNTTDPNQIEAAYKALKQLMPNVLLFNSDSPARPFIDGEVSLGAIWNGAVHQAREAGLSIQMVNPQEGAIFWMDSLAIPDGARHVNNAMRFIDFLLRPDIAAKISINVGYSTPNLGARAMLPKIAAEDSLLYPDKKFIQQGEWQVDVGEINQYYEYYFERLKAGG